MTMKNSLLILGVTLLFPAAALASHWEISRLGHQLQLASDQLAQRVRFLPGYANVGQRAGRLSLQAAQITDSIERQRSSGYVRVQFAELSRNYQHLERAIWQVNRKYAPLHISNSFEHVSILYNSLYTYIHQPVMTANRHRDKEVLKHYPSAPVHIPRALGDSGHGELFDSRRHPDPDRYDHRSPVIERQYHRENERFGHDAVRVHKETETRRLNHHESRGSRSRPGH
jgi:hypothetical protein